MRTEGDTNKKCILLITRDGKNSSHFSRSVDIYVHIIGRMKEKAFYCVDDIINIDRTTNMTTVCIPVSHCDYHFFDPILSTG